MVTGVPDIETVVCMQVLALAHPDQKVDVGTVG